MKTFIKNYKKKYNEQTLSYKAGYIDEDGCICNAQKGAEDTFCVGMPIYDLNNNLIGNLSIGLFDGLNYSDRDLNGNEIPVYFWEVKGYKGKPQNIKTYYQLIK